MRVGLDQLGGGNDSNQWFLPQRNVYGTKNGKLHVHMLAFFHTQTPEANTLY